MTAPAADELSRSDPATPGISRRRQGRGFRYLRASSEPVTDPATLARIKSLVIPPAWQEVWICSDPAGHIQATGVDAAGRRQYLYHQRWREEQDQRKFDRMAEFGGALPHIREKVLAELEGRGLHRERVMAAALRLIDLGFFRAGGEEYAAEHETFGLATIRREHVTCGRRQLTFEYPAKGGIQREQAIADERLCVVVRSLKRRHWGGDELLAWRNGSGRPHDVTAADINDYLREVSGADFTAKDFRTWNATVLAAVGLAVSGHAETDSARKRAVARGPGGRGLPRQHAGGRPRLVHRPPGHRPLRARPHDRAGAGRSRRVQRVRRAGHPGPRRGRGAAHPSANGLADR